MVQEGARPTGPSILSKNSSNGGSAELSFFCLSVGCHCRWPSLVALVEVLVGCWLVLDIFSLSLFVGSNFVFPIGFCSVIESGKV